METNFNFKSQICTDKVQSERLLALGLKKETADMGWVKLLDGDGYVIAIAEDYSFIDIPAWSLHRLIEMMPQSIHIKEGDFCLRYFMGTIDYVDDDFRNLKFFDNGNVYDNIVDCIEWLIKKGYFNKEYLV